jgi:hypothetical protein
MPAVPRFRAGFACVCKRYGDDAASIKAFGLDVVTDLCEQLRAGGAPALAFLHHEPKCGEVLKLVCEGEVVRVDRKNGVTGIAAKLGKSFFTNVATS